MQDLGAHEGASSHRGRPGLGAALLMSAALPLATGTVAPGALAAPSLLGASARVRLALLLAQDVPSRGVSLGTKPGALVLRGQVRSLNERFRVEEVARRAARVPVSSELTVKPYDPARQARLQGERLAESVRDRIAADNTLNGIAVGGVRGDVVVLQGRAGLAEARRAMRLVLSTPGVRGVRNEIELPRRPRD